MITRQENELVAVTYLNRESLPSVNFEITDRRFSFNFRFLKRPMHYYVFWECLLKLVKQALLFDTTRLLPAHEVSYGFDSTVMSV